ncbi:restriction endonuclease subunit S [Stutzerimonas stutzeri]|uniref:restriction endonuclease subunit S n=1 Tax=Stutzerimonas stutzeri TaxID=316 RepID=UPI002446AE89|nr:restriction endonuclease subunit S [Stutzerimonas stutzeri]MDH0102157.1 restriction endonuclease subunit S [Stutzerimonas stutzeri]
MIERDLKPGWRRVKFGDVVRLSKARSKDPMADGIERYVGLEHLEPGDLRICRWGNVADGVTFTSVFQPGQVLFGKRRAYQRKVAVADFSGVCSGDIYVLETTDAQVLLPELLPFICQTDAFFDHAVGTSAGSLSPRTNWTSLANFEFALPPIDQQRRAVELLASGVALLEAEHSLLATLDALYFSTIDALLAETKAKLARLDAVTTKIVDGAHKTPSYASAGVPFLVVENLTRGPGIDFSDTRFVTEADHKELFKRANPERGDVLVSKDGTLGVARFIDTDIEFSLFVSVALLKPNRELLSGKYLRYFFDSTGFRRRIGQKTSGSAIKHIHLVDFRSTEIPLPPLRKQEEIADTISEIDSSRIRALQKLNDSKRFISGIGNRLVQGEMSV